MSESEKEPAVVTAGQIALKAFLSTLPGGGAITAGYEIFNLLNSRVAEQIERRNEQRYEEFIDSLLKDGVSDATVEGLTVDDYHALLSACLGDIENEKAAIYGSVARAVGANKVQKHYKRFLIKTVNQLTLEQLELLRNAHVATFNSLKPSSGGGDVQPKDVLRSLGGVSTLNYKALEAQGVVEDHKLNNFGLAVVEACYEFHQLSPQSVSAPVWNPGHIQIVFLCDISAQEYWRCVLALSSLAAANNFKSTNFHFELVGRPHVYDTHRSFIAIFPEVLGDIGKYRDKLAKFAKDRRAIVIDYGDNLSEIAGMFPSYHRVAVKELNGQSIEDAAFAAFLDDEKEGA